MFTRSVGTLKSSSPADRLRWLGLALALLLVDQATKYAASIYLDYGERRAVTEFFNWTLLHNTGAAFSFLADAGGWQRAFLIGVAVVISASLLGWLWRGVASQGQAIALSAILGGALGNLTDRLLRGHVVDFLDFHYAQYHWPAFNLADVWIITGAASLMWAHTNTASERIGRIAESRLGLPASPPLAGHARVILNDRYGTTSKSLPAKSMENTMKLFVALLLSLLGAIVGTAPAAVHAARAAWTAAA